MVELCKNKYLKLNIRLDEIKLLQCFAITDLSFLQMRELMDDLLKYRI